MGNLCNDKIQGSETRDRLGSVVFLPSAHGDWGQCDQTTAGQSVIGLYLPLYLVMLAFFVMLTANGTFDTARGNDVLRSVSSAFASVMPLIRGRIGDGLESRMRDPRETAMHVEHLFRRHGFTTVSSWEGHGALVMKAEVTSFFRDADVRFSPDRHGMLARLADLLTGIPGAEVAFLLGDRDPLAMERAVFLDDNWPLIAPTVPAEIGILPGEGGLTIQVDVPGAG